MSKLSRRTAWAIRTVAVLAAVPACYLLLVAIDSRSAWVIIAVVVAVGIGGGGVVAGLTAPRRPGGDRRGLGPGRR